MPAIDRSLSLILWTYVLQRLVGGDENASLDLEDLRKYVIYEGGYHSRHKVIKNLWQVSFQWKNPDFLFKNPDFLLRNPDFLLKNG